jgi:hypothetical protein
MTTFKQIEANRRNARRSTGPTSYEGKLRSRRNAVRHGLTAETVIGALEDAEDCKAFEAAVTADYDAQSAVERELVLRLASLLWRIRRATAIETGLFDIQARQLLEFRRRRDARQKLLHRLFGPNDSNHERVESVSEQVAYPAVLGPNADHCSPDLAQCYLRLANLPSYPLDRLSRYEAALWRQAAQTIFALHALHRRRPRECPSRLRPNRRQEWPDEIQENN